MLRAGARHPDADESASASTACDDDSQLYATLNEYLLLENKFQPKLCLPDDLENGEVTTRDRDGAAHVLRCLKVWYDLPCDVLFNALNLFDRFLTKMKVRPCHVPCITVSCMNIAIEQHAHDSRTERKVSVEELVSISQSACTAGDVTRMSRVIADKLSLAAAVRAVTALHWLQLFRGIVAAACRQLQLVLPALQESELVNQLEICVCDARCANARASELALVILYRKLDEQVQEWTRKVSSEGGSTEQAYYLNEFAAQLQAHCNMCPESVWSARRRATRVLQRYDARGAACACARQRLVWRLSERTLKVLRPTDRLTSLLPTIEEQHHVQDQSPPRNRSGSESSENEETSDWPRSPVLPVYCDN
ncbi:cyclin G [Plodia interpunctella]|uniref:cyclin G n=1 Tax=Plodia interpunctella TaxID=58824 RepID=UPI002367F9C1|nr:cyclin G [Plodia interpunctella]XP_053622547.1 cyclin G [Plodia interpunctella]